MKEQPILIVGAGGHGAELYSYLHDIRTQGNQFFGAGFIDDNKGSGVLLTAEILGPTDDLPEILHQLQYESIGLITAIGNNYVRQQLVKKIDDLDLQNCAYWTLRHPSALTGCAVEIGHGTCLAPGSIVTTRTRLGDHVILNIKASVSHDCMIGDYVNINPSATICGCVNIGTGCYIGAGATIKDHVTIGEWTTIGAGAVVIEDLPSHVTAIGVPARIIRTDKDNSE